MTSAVQYIRLSLIRLTSRLTRNITSCCISAYCADIEVFIGAYLHEKLISVDEYSILMVDLLRV